MFISKFKEKEKENKINKTRRRNKKIKTSINKLKCLKQINKSRLLKQKLNSLLSELFIDFYYKSMHIYCKKCRKHAGNTFPRKFILISKNKIKGKSKCNICLTGSTFIDEIKGGYDLESELEIYLQFFTD